MKRILEGASVLTAIFMIFSVGAFFIFSIQNKTNKSKERKRSEEMIREAQVDYEKKIHQKEKEIEDIKKEFELFYEEMHPFIYQGN